MSLRSRLRLVIGVVALLPLLVGGVIAGLVVPRSLTEQSTAQVQTSAAALQSVLAATCRAAGQSVRGLAAEAGAGDQAALPAVLARAGADYAAVLGPGGTVVAQVGVRPPDVDPASAATCSTGGTGAAVVLERVALTSPRLPAARTAVLADRIDLRELGGALGPNRDYALLDAGRIVASSAPSQAARLVSLASSADGRGAASDADYVGYVTRPAAGVPWRVVVVQERPSVVRLEAAIAAAWLLSAALALLIGGWIARSLTRPLDELGEAADRVAAGDLDLRVPVRAGDEVGHLGERFNDMTLELRSTIGELERSRDAMAASLARLGATLRNTHDLNGLLDAVLETAITMSGAEAGIALALDGNAFSRVAERGLGDLGLVAPRRTSAGRGVLGSIASAPGVISGRLGDPALGAEPLPEEPSRGHVLAASLVRGDRVVGILGLYKRPDSAPFAAAAADSVRTLAEQAGIAVDNVMLHREAQRLSITDPLTGLWNFRFLSMTLAKEIERATRFGHKLAVLMLDLDRFKHVNDTYGHARGDAVLREMAGRITEVVREVDVVARYGGEEFVLVLPQTDLDGATMLAERVCTALRREPFGKDTGVEPLDVTVSIGIAAFPQHGSSPATLMRSADTALYAAKAAGRDRWSLAEDPDDVGAAAGLGDLDDFADNRFALSAEDRPAG